MHRMRFSKLDDAVWISHLDTMRLFQRAFRRANVSVKHTEGFNPHAFVSIAMPMSVGTQSQCELLDFTLLPGEVTLEQLPELLNRVLPAGVRVLEAYDTPNKLSGLKYLHARVTLTYDKEVPAEAAEKIKALFAGPELVVMKKSKRGTAPTDILPMIRSLQVLPDTDTTLVLDAVVSANEPSLNPDLLASAIRSQLPELAPDAHQTLRLEVLDQNGEIFR